MPAIAMSPTLSPKEVFEHYGLKPNHLAQLRYQKKGPRYIQATPRTVPTKRHRGLADRQHGGDRGQQGNKKGIRRYGCRDQMKEGSNEQHHSNRQQGNRNPRPSLMVERRLPLRGDVNQDRVQGAPSAVRS